MAFVIVNGLSSALPVPAPPVAEPRLVGLLTSSAKALIAKALFALYCLSVVSPSIGASPVGISNHMKASTSGLGCAGGPSPTVGGGSGGPPMDGRAGAAD